MSYNNNILNERIFFKGFRNYIAILLMIAMLVSLLLRQRIYGFHLLGILSLCISFLMIKLFYYSNIRVNSKLFRIRLFIFSFFLNAIFVFIIGWILQHINGMPFLSFGDDFLYNEKAISLAEQWEQNGFSISEFYKGSYSGFPNFSAILMYISGIHDWWIPRIGNSFLGALSCLLIYNIIEFIYKNEKIAKLISSFLAFSPLIVVYSSLQLKDILLVFLLLASFNCYIKVLWNRLNFKEFLLMLLFLSLMLFVRPATMIAFLISMVIYQLFFHDTAKLKKRKVITSILILALAISVWNYLDRIDFLTSSDSYIDRYFMERTDGSLVQGDKSFISQTSYTQLLSVPIYILISPFFPTPLITKIDENNLFFTNFEYAPSILYVALLPFCITSMIIIIKKKQMQSIAPLFVIFYLVYRSGQCLTLSIFSLRQSLPAVFCLFLILPIAFYNKDLQKVRNLIFLITVIFMILFSSVRYLIRI